MRLRDKLAARVAPFLQPGEQIQQVFRAEAAVHPLLFGGYLVRILLRNRRIVAVTDRSIVVLAADLSGTSPTELLSRLPRHTRIGEVYGIYAKVQLGGEKLYVHSRFHPDVRAADAARNS